MGLEVVNFLRRKNVNRLFALVNLGITVLLAFPILGEVVFNYLSGNIKLLSKQGRGSLSHLLKLAKS